MPIQRTNCPRDSCEYTDDFPPRRHCHGPKGTDSEPVWETLTVQRRRATSRVFLRTTVIWELLDKLDISQNELARRCGISRGYMSQLMRWERSPSPMLRRRLQEVLGVDDFHVLFIVIEPEEQDGGS